MNYQNPVEHFLPFKLTMSLPNFRILTGRVCLVFAEFTLSDRISNLLSVFGSLQIQRIVLVVDSISLSICSRQRIFLLLSSAVWWLVLVCFCLRNARASTLIGLGAIIHSLSVVSFKISILVFGIFFESEAESGRQATKLTSMAIIPKRNCRWAQFIRWSISGQVRIPSAFSKLGW